ncbi:glycosyltransferase family 4 protein [Arthrobacter monumenti]
MADVLFVLTRRRRDSVSGVFAAYISGHVQEVTALLKSALANGVTGQGARRLSDLALSAGEAQLAGDLLERVDDSVRGRATTVARCKWYAGDMSGAVAALEDERGPGRRQRGRLAAEVKVFQGGWTPRVPPAHIEPVKNRVLHILTNSLPHTGSGYAQRSHSILIAQEAIGWDARAVTRLGYPVQIGALLARSSDVVDGVEYERLIPGKLADGLDGRLQQQTEALSKIVRSYRPSVLHTTTHFVNGLVVREVARAHGIPWVYEVRGQLADTWASSRGEGAYYSERYKLFRAREAELMRSADLVITLGEAMQSEIQREGVLMENIVIAPNAVGEQYLADPLSSAEARADLGLPGSGVWIGTVSSLVDYEGLDDLLSAAAELAPAYPSLRVLIVGDGTSAPALRRQANTLGISDKVVFAGRVPRAQSALYHQAVDIFVVPRKDSAVTRAVTPLKPVEAMACARPVVASNLPALAEAVRHGENGLLVNPESPAELAEALKELLIEEPLRTAFGLAGRRFVLAERTWAKNAAAYDEAYTRIGVTS